jgi:hypothetical protein
MIDAKRDIMNKYLFPVKSVKVKTQPKHPKIVNCEANVELFYGIKHWFTMLMDREEDIHL